MYDRSKKMHGKNKNCTSAIQKLFAKFRPSTEATTYSAFLTDPYPISSFYGWLIDVDRFPYYGLVLKGPSHLFNKFQ
jgi:hypothetical protein